MGALSALMLHPFDALFITRIRGSPTTLTSPSRELRGFVVKVEAGDVIIGP
jgi:hypothetical protein